MRVKYCCVSPLSKISVETTLPIRNLLEGDYGPPTEDFPIPDLFRLRSIYDCVNYRVNLQTRQ